MTRRGRERSNDRSSERKERGSDEFNLGEWGKKPSTQREEGLAGLREKLKEARDEETRKESDEMKSRWGAREPIGPPPVPPPALNAGPPPGGLAENRSSVAMSWGSVQKTNRASSDRASAERGIKVAPIVGKMPWAKGTVGGRKSKFGPPVEGGVPPPSIVTSQPTLQAAPGQDPPHQNWGPPPGHPGDLTTMAMAARVVIRMQQVLPLDLLLLLCQSKSPRRQAATRQSTPSLQPRLTWRRCWPLLSSTCRSHWRLNLKASGCQSLDT